MVSLLPTDVVFALGADPEIVRIAEDGWTDCLVGRESSREVLQDAIHFRRQKSPRRPGIGCKPLIACVTKVVVGKRVKRLQQLRVQQMKMHRGWPAVGMPPRRNGKRSAYVSLVRKARITRALETAGVIRDSQRDLSVINLLKADVGVVRTT